jgi:hypothetical protein
MFKTTFHAPVILDAYKTVLVNVTVSWNVMSDSILNIYQHWEAVYCIHHQVLAQEIPGSSMTLPTSTRIYGITFQITVMSKFHTCNVTCRKLFGTNNMLLEGLWKMFLALMFFGDAFYFIIKEIYKDRFPHVSKYQTTKAYWGSSIKTPCCKDGTKWRWE